MTDNPCFLTIAEAGQAFRDGSLTPSALTQAFLERIEVLNPKLNAYLLVTADEARAAQA